MSFKSFFSGLAGKLKTGVEKGWDLLQKAGLDDEALALATKYVKTAEVKYLDNNERREWVVRAMIDHKVPEAVARVAVEMALKIFKREVSDKLDAELAKQKAGV